jgi:4-hydroxy-4-methyl-2-oxoglutarate aldolase
LLPGALIARNRGNGMENAGSVTLAQMRERFFTALLSDVLDALGHTRQAMKPSIRPLDDSLVMVGRARTGLYADVYAMPAPGENPYELEIALIDSLQRDEVPVFACGATGRIAPWGELLSTASQTRGAAGAVMDGLVRDIRAIREMRFPVFHGGIGPLDSKGRGKVVAVDVPVECAGVLVSPGDLVYGDADGCVVVPKAIERQVIEAALEKLKGEKKTLAALRAGEKLGDVFARFGVL